MLAAQAQSQATLEAVRLHRDDGRALATEELKQCETSGCPGLARLSLLSGVLALAAGEAEVAGKILAAHGAPKGLESHHAFYSGEAAFYARDFEAAAHFFELALKAVPHPLELRATARAGEAWLAARQPAKALPFLEKATASWTTPELLFERAEARSATGQQEEARADWKTVALKFPAHPYAIEAAEHLPAARGVPLFTFNERLTRTRGFLDAGAAQQALAELDAIDNGKLARGASAQAREALLKAEALFALGKEEDAQKQVDRALKGQRPVAAEAALLRARRYLRASDNPKARAEMAGVDKAFPKEPVAEEAGYFVGWLDLQGGRFADAVKSFEQFDKRHSSSRRRDEALWFKSLALIRLERYLDAKKALEGLTAQFPRSSLVPQARYWSVRAQQLGGAKPEEVIPRFVELARTFPGSFYALLSTTRLRELSVDPPALFPEHPAARNAKVPEALKLAVALAETGLFRDAGDEVTDRLWAVRTQDDALSYGAALQSLGEFGSAYTVGVRLLWGAAYTQRKPEALALLYPRAFRDAVESQAKDRQLDPFFVWSIMRRESAFRPEVVSVANARGLLQLIPRTSSGIAKALDEPEPEPDTLYSPQINIHYATWYLAELFKRFNHPVLVAAAYNASPDAVLRWLAANGTMPLDLFVEMIPFKETRGYVKQVVADYHVYNALYGAPDAQPKLALTVPTPSPGGVSF